jgi:UDP-N-acetylglucosamine--N-acetylmuramyl-(pentapeptide) pyrophosphoryl-undecaprenol N-acetylglucosamine transferase
VRPLVRHQCGERTLDIAKQAYAEHDVEVELLPFIEDMAEAYAWADLVICRAGALTIAELCAVGVPALLVPFPGAVDDHQTANGRPMAEAGAALIIPESELSPEYLADLLREWLQSRAELQQRAAKARALSVPDSLNRITEICLEQAGAIA